MAGDAHASGDAVPDRPHGQGHALQADHRESVRGDRPVYDQGFVGPNGDDFAFNFGSPVAGPGRENFDTVYQFDTNPAVSPEEQHFNDTVIRVTASTEQVYARRAIAAGTDDLPVQRAIRGRGHCEFLAAELTTAFDDLVNWVVNDTKPHGDNILDPANVAAPDFGCKFTTATHPQVPACQ